MQPSPVAADSYGRLTPIKHRHGGGGFRQGFCTGSLVYSLDQIAFRSIDDPDHGFAVEPEDIRRIEFAKQPRETMIACSRRRPERHSTASSSRIRSREPSAILTDIDHRREDLAPHMEGRRLERHSILDQLLNALPKQPVDLTARLEQPEGQVEPLPATINQAAAVARVSPRRLRDRAVSRNTVALDI